MVVDEVDRNVRRRHPDAAGLRLLPVEALAVPQILDLARGAVVFDHAVEGDVLLREVERAVDHVALGVGAHERVVAVERLAEQEEVVLAAPPRRLADPRTPLAPEALLDVLERVDPEAVEINLADPIGEHAHERTAYVLALGREILEPAGKIGEQHLIARPVAVGIGHDTAAAVIPVGVLELGGLGRHAVDRRHADPANGGEPHALVADLGVNAVRIPIGVVLRHPPERRAGRGAGAIERLVRGTVEVDVVVEQLPYVVGDHVGDHQDVVGV